MSRLTLRLPQTLHHQLSHLAEGEGVSLNQYIVYALARQVTTAYSVRSVSKEEVDRQQQDFKTLLQRLGEASLEEISEALAERETVEPEEGLSHEAISLLQQRTNNAAKF